MRNVTHVVAILKLAQILRKMLATDMDMGAVDRSLQLRPKAFERVDASTGLSRILTAIMVHLDVAIAALVDVLIPAHFVGADRRAGYDVMLDKRVHRHFGSTGDDAGNQLASAFQHPDDNGLIPHVAVAFAAYRAADNRFVNLDGAAYAAKRIVAVERRHIFADFMAHAPRRFVGYAKLTLDFLSRHPMPRSAEQEDDIKPIAQRGPRPVHRRVSGRKDLMAAKVASVRAPFRDRMKPRFASAFVADVRDAVAGRHKMLQTSILGRKPLLKLAQSGGFRFHTDYIRPKSPWRKGIIADLIRGP